MMHCEVPKKITLEGGSAMRVCQDQAFYLHGRGIASFTIEGIMVGS
jgi:hypothetical protein